MQPPVDPVWVMRTETLEIRFGPFKLCDFPFPGLSLLSNPFVTDPKLEAPIERAAAMGCEAVVKYAMPIGQRFAAIRVQRAAIRYATRYGVRYVVDFKGSFEKYLNKFSRKSRHELKRTVRRFGEERPGMANIVEYRTPSEIGAFREIAIRISHRSYKGQIGWGFEESESFARGLELDAGQGIVRGFVLMLDNEPAAYGFCRIEHDVIVYKHTGYDEQFARRSPGKVLLYLMLQSLFREGEFRLLDFDGMEHFPYTEFFATRVIRCARVVWFRPTLRNAAAVGCHWVVAATWRIAAAFRISAWRSTAEWPSVRRLPRMWARALTRPRRIS
jgi:CelD/BcsL family acetyltransferase involved in cellulose biosynthesis